MCTSWCSLHSSKACFTCTAWEWAWGILPARGSATKCRGVLEPGVTRGFTAAEPGTCFDHPQTHKQPQAQSQSTQGSHNSIKERQRQSDTKRFGTCCVLHPLSQVKCTPEQRRAWGRDPKAARTSKGRGRAHTPAAWVGVLG